MSKRFLIWGVTCVALVGFVVGLVYLAKQDAAQKPQDSAGQVAGVATSDWIKGPATATVTLIEYSDLQCPACAFYHPFLKQLSSEYSDRVRIVYRHFPLKQIHKNAEPAARVAEAAGRQGKFWEMQDLLFENQEKWSSEQDPAILFRGYAESLTLDGEKFMSDFAAPEVAAKVQGDYQSGVAAKVQGTPTFFLNGVRIENPRNYDGFKDVIERALAAGS